MAIRRKDAVGQDDQVVGQRFAVEREHTIHQGVGGATEAGDQPAVVAARLRFEIRPGGAVERRAVLRVAVQPIDDVAAAHAERGDSGQFVGDGVRGERHQSEQHFGRVGRRFVGEGVQAVGVEVDQVAQVFGVAKW